MEFRELSDVEWSLIGSFLPPRSGKGRRALVDDRAVLNGILYVLSTGCRWMDMPRKYGSYVTAWRRLKRWHELGVWDRVLEALASMKVGERIAVDSSTVEAKKGESS